jgi:Aminoacyl-tRNA editing domain
VSIQSVRAFLAEKAPDIAIIELTPSTATVALAASAHGVEPKRIAKALSLRIGGRNLLLVVHGDARLDNRKMKFSAGKQRALTGGGINQTVVRNRLARRGQRRTGDARVLDLIARLNTGSFWQRGCGVSSRLIGSPLDGQNFRSCQPSLLPQPDLSDITCRRLPSIPKVAEWGRELPSSP